jgi:putative FmdB family regulatory protein
MPIYEYRCDECDEITEDFDKITSTTKTIPCSFCEQPATRIMSLGSFQLKGGGWYKDGYGKKISSEKTVASKPKTVGGVTKARSIADN